MKKYLIKVNGNQYEVEVEEVREGNSVSQNINEVKEVKTAPAAVTKTLTQKPAAAVKDNSVPEGASTITSPMPGTILKIDVKKGDVVKKGQVLLILEAMKMENEIAAPNDGGITSVNVEKGASVNAGDVLISMA